MANYDAHRPRREDPSVVGIDETGKEHVLPGLVAGPGWEQRNPEPGSPGWQEIVQAGVSSAAAADPPNEQELAIWRRVAAEQLPLDFVHRNDATLTLQVPKWWPLDRNSMVAEAVTTKSLELEWEDDPDPADTSDIASSVARILLSAIEMAPFAITVSRHVEAPVHRGDQHLYPWDAWGEIVTSVLEAVAARLLPEEDGVVVGRVEKPDLVAQALALLAQAQK